MLQRLVTWLDLGVDRYDYRLYAIAQSSFAATLLLSGAIATISQSPRKAFNILTLNCLVHLLLDALQTKWANGVHLLAPVSWQLLNLELFWPESVVSYLLTAFGLVTFGYLMWRNDREPIGLSLSSPLRNATAAVLLSSYLVVPYLWSSGPQHADNHSIATLRAERDRAGRYAEFDRTEIMDRPTGQVLKTFTDEEISLLGPSDIPPGCVSIQGTFVDAATLHVQRFHSHRGSLRELGSWVGLVLVCFSWLQPIVGHLFRDRQAERSS
jgi:hypothetical protein